MANTSEQHDFRGKDINEPFRLLILIVGTIILIAGILGNDLLLVVLFKRRQERRFRNIFISNLAVADVVVIMSVMPFFLVDLLMGHHPVVNQLHCSVNAFLLCVSYLVSILSLVVVSFHRYIKVCHRHVFHKLFNAKRNRAICVALWLLAAFINVPCFGMGLEYGYDSRARLCNMRAERITPDYGSIVTICMLVVPVILIGFFNTAIFRRWYGSHRKLKNRKRRVNVPKATWKSFLSMSADNMFTLDYSDSLGDVTSNTGVPNKSRIRNSESYSDLTSSTVYTASSDCDVEMRNIVRPVLWNPDPFVYRRNDVSRNTNRKVTFLAANPTKAVSNTTDILTCSRNLDKGSTKLHSRRRRTSILCEALDLNTIVPITDIPIDPDDDVIEPDHGEEEGASAAISPATEMEDWDNSTEADRNSEPIYLDTPNVDRPSSQRKKSLYPSIDRGGHFLNWRRKSACYRKHPPSDLALVRSLLVISICLFVLYTPFVTTLILTFIIHHHLPPEVSVMSTLLLFVNCAINWAVYGVMNTAFRQAYVTTLRNFWQCCLGFRRRTASNASSVGPATHHPDQ